MTMGRRIVNRGRCGRQRERKNSFFCVSQLETLGFLSLSFFKSGVSGSMKTYGSIRGGGGGVRGGGARGVTTGIVEVVR